MSSAMAAMINLGSAKAHEGSMPSSSQQFQAAKALLIGTLHVMALHDNSSPLTSTAAMGHR
jgi:hypothetical protein